jgi:hypothetical protein
MTTIEELLNFKPPCRPAITDEIKKSFIERIKGKTFTGAEATLLSRYGNTNYHDHPLKWIRFSEDGSKLISHCPGPQGSDASVAGPFLLVGFDRNGDCLIELQYGCRTTFSLKIEQQ